MSDAIGTRRSLSARLERSARLAVLGRRHPVMLGQRLDDVLLGGTVSAARDFFFLSVAVIPVAIGVDPIPPRFGGADSGLERDVQKLAIRVRNIDPHPGPSPIVRAMLELCRLALRGQVAPELLERLGWLPLHQLANLLELFDGVLLAIQLLFGRILLRLVLSAHDPGDVVHPRIRVGHRRLLALGSSNRKYRWGACYAEPRRDCAGQAAALAHRNRGPL